MKIQYVFRLAMGLLLASCSGRPQALEIPDNVRNSFSAMYGTEFNPNWEVTPGSLYKAIFPVDRNTAVASFDSTGNWLKTEVEIDASALPEVIVKTVTGAFYGNGITKALRVEKPGSEITYEIFLRRHYNISPLELSTGGVILNKDF